MLTNTRAFAVLAVLPRAIMLTYTRTFAVLTSMPVTIVLTNTRAFAVLACLPSMIVLAYTRAFAVLTARLLSTMLTVSSPTVSAYIFIATVLALSDLGLLGLVDSVLYRIHSFKHRL